MKFVIRLASVIGLLFFLLLVVGLLVTPDASETESPVGESSVAGGSVAAADPVDEDQPAPEEMKRGTRYLGEGLSMQQRAALLERAQSEGWCISTADCDPGRACGLPVELVATFRWRQRTTGFSWEEKSNSMRLCSNPVCREEYEESVRGELQRANSLPQMEIASISFSSDEL
jgi:hypothetical protein